jgi:regulator of sigma E protease
MVTVVSAVVLLGVLIFVHELGHFLVAKRAGVGVTTFSLGFGPKLVGFRKGETEYRISAVPLGGYVRMVGENPGEEVAPEDLPRSFGQKPVGWRIAIVGAGPVSNIVFALIVYYVVLVGFGLPQLTTLVGGVQKGLPAAEAGIQENDRVLRINGKPMEHWGDMVEAVQGSGGEPVKLLVEREGRRLHLTMQPEKVEATDIFGQQQSVYRVGIVAAGEMVTKEVGPLEATSLAAEKAYGAAALIAVSVYKLITREVSMDSLGGPILIAQAAGQAARHGLAPFLDLAGLISVNLAVLNLLPIPALDGGHLFFFLVEAVRRKPVSLAWREKAQQMGMALLLLLMVVIFYNDIARIVTGGTP